MYLRKLVLVALPIVLLLSGTAFGQGGGKKVKGGPEIGTKVENFSLVDQAGKKRELKEFLKKGPVAVVFYRSADW